MTTPDDDTTAGAELEAQAAEVRAAIRAALAAGGGTAELRHRLRGIEDAMREQADRIAHFRAAAEGDQKARVAEKASETARASAERLKFRLATLAPPRAPHLVRGRSR
ncbi:hypothetical protein KPL78_04205 [Roseomonas sp. HJA6]|uniref:Uncharacterized protein n=1 Tax=Roseomonas alba TaxID=2846776 RepID=A0ABS7A4K1_9PROT|nr:hypothetical protein [Neoroseomonas alba]MBW6397035.1 hypothetical protein [Neoroseomonas alba]